MPQFQVFDSPIGNPDEDIFGMKEYAEMLADFLGEVPPPYTIGIYGEWGEGKTSFVKLFQWYLEENAKKRTAPNPPSNQAGKTTATKNQTKFIDFSAWEHTTSDALWRALIIKIASELYETKPSANGNANGGANSDGLWRRVSKFLASDAYVFYKPPATPDPTATYQSLMSAIDKNLYGSISKSADQQRDVNQEMAFMSVINAAMSALGTVSPLVAGVRGLLGLNSSINLSEVFAEKNQATRKMIETIAEFKTTFKALFASKVNEYHRVFVFVDDLDRCLPDVALDLLEAIKVFLHEVDFIFIVAADENLIGQGLRIRFRELFSGNEQQESQSFFDVKGQEYFEKIIQFAVRVPPRTPEQTHRFIAGQFPKWTPATDIIQTAIGNNPRRLKQYCNLLTYKSIVAQLQKSRASKTGKDERSLSKAEMQLLDKLIALHCQGEDYLEKVTSLVRDPGKFTTVLPNIETLLIGAKENDVHPDATKLLTEPRYLELYKTITQNAALLRLMQSPPNFSTEKPFEITTLSRLSDSRPFAGGSTISSKNSFFMRILSSDETTTARTLLIEDFTKLVHFSQHFKEVCDLLFAIASDEKWISQMRAIENDMTSTVKTSGLSPNAEKLRDLMLEYKESKKAKKQECYKLFVNPPLFSTMLPEEVQLISENHQTLPAADSLLAEVFKSANEIDKSHRLADATIKLLAEDEKFKELEASITLQLKVATYFLELRKFAKVDALNFKWRALGQQLRLGGAAPLKALEAEALKPVPSYEALPESWRPYLRDASLLRFLALRPLFKEFYKQDFDDYFAAAQTVKAEEQVVVPQPAAAPAAPSEPALATPPQVVSLFDNLRLIITAKDPTNPDNYLLSIVVGKEAPVTSDITITETDFEELKVTLGQSFQFRGLSSRPATRQWASGPVAARFADMDLEAILIRTGSRLFNVIFSDQDARRTFIEALRNRSHVRIVLELDGSRLEALPWENLYVPELNMFPSVHKKYSIVRHFSDAISLFPRTLVPPLKILVVVASPEDAPPLDVQRERETLEKTLAAAVQNGQVKLEFSKNGTIEEVQRLLRLFEPHLFHFVGHGVFMDDKQHGVLLFEDENNRSRVTEAETVRKLLVDSNISLAVLNACDTGASGKLDAITGVAGTLVHNGIPAAIATMRNVMDTAALRFTREFYTAFVDGYTLERSLTESRKALSFEKEDWAAYALFTGTTNLDAFRLTSVQRGSENSLSQ